MEIHQKQPQGLTPTQPETTSNGLNPKLKTEIVGQKDRENAVAGYLLGVWVKVRIEILQMSPTIVPTESKEELGLVLRLMRQYGTITPAEFAEAIRAAAIVKQRELSQGLQKFPTLYAADFEDEIQKLTLKKMKEEPTRLMIASNTGGDMFAGEPADALAREWPKIYAHTKLMRQTINPKMRDRFWCQGSEAQRKSAFAVVAQMVWDMKQEGQWDQRQHEWEMLAIFQSEYRDAFQGWERLLDQGMTAPLSKAAVDDLRRRTEMKISQTVTNGGSPPSIEFFPDPMDCTYCAVFDAYWKFWESQASNDQK